MEKIQLPEFGASPQPSETFFFRNFSVTPHGIFDEVEGTGVVYLHSERFGKTNTNHVISFLDLSIENKKKTTDNRIVRVNWDNWNGNKSYVTLVYLNTLVEYGKYDEAEGNFMLAGHTKFSPDRMFAWLTELLKSHDIFEVNDILNIVQTATRLKSEKERQTSYRVVSAEDVTADGFSSFFRDYKTQMKNFTHNFKAIAKSHQFRIHKVNGKTVMDVKEFSDDMTAKRYTFQGLPTLPTLDRIKPIPLKQAKINDLRKYLPYIPGHRLSYVPDGP